jgi:DNA-binding response OmpR family regulator
MKTVLVVEDNCSVRDVIRRILESAGFAVLCARDGQEALVVSDEHAERIDLVLTDVVMPVIGGPMLAELLKVSRCGARILYMSGWPSQVLERNGLRPWNGSLIQKPFTVDELVARVRSALA